MRGLVSDPKETARHASTQVVTVTSSFTFLITKAAPSLLPNLDLGGI